MTENEKAKFQNPFTYNDQRNFVECNPVKETSDDLVYLTKSHTSSDSIFSEEREEIAEDIPALAEDVPAPVPTPAPSEEREEIVEDVPAPAEDVPTPAPTPAPADTLEKVEGQPYTPGSRKSMKKNFGRPVSAYSDFYM